MKWWRHLPNVLTLINLMSGTAAIIAFFQFHFTVTLYLVGICLLTDVLDGPLARKWKVDGGIGAQLDSLADLVSFGVLPACMLFSMGSIFGYQVMDVIKFILIASVAGSAGWRLARFNLDTRPREYFWGLPTPAGGIFVTGWMWAMTNTTDVFTLYQQQPWIVYGICIGLAVLYQVPLKLLSLKSPQPGRLTVLFIAALTVVGLLIIGPVSIPLGILLYVLIGVLNVFLRWY